MKIFAFALMVWRPENLEQPLMLANAFDLSSFGYFQRSSVKEFMIFFCRTLMQRTARSQRQSVDHENYVCHIHLRSDGLGGIAVCDQEYPQRVAYTALSNLLTEFHELHGEVWPTLKEDTILPFPKLDQAIVDFQNPANADKLTKIHEDLEKTISIVHKTIDSVLDRGTKLENLVKQSEDLGMQSKLFYQNAASANKCCTIM
jgi:synaptobrevin family protein YKT6